MWWNFIRTVRVTDCFVSLPLYWLSNRFRFCVWYEHVGKAIWFQSHSITRTPIRRSWIIRSDCRQWRQDRRLLLWFLWCQDLCQSRTIRFQTHSFEAGYASRYWWSTSFCRYLDSKQARVVRAANKYQAFPWATTSWGVNWKLWRSKTILAQSLQWSR